MGHLAAQESKSWWIPRTSQISDLHVDSGLRLVWNTVVVLQPNQTNNEDIVLGTSPSYLPWAGFVFLGYNKQRWAKKRLPYLIRSGDAHAPQPSVLKGIRGSFKRSLAIQKYASPRSYNPQACQRKSKRDWRSRIRRLRLGKESQLKLCSLPVSSHNLAWLNLFCHQGLFVTKTP